MKKVVSNLLSDISKARDIIARGDIREINRKMVVFDRISRQVKTQLTLYIRNPAHELDFNHEDLIEHRSFWIYQELPTEIYLQKVIQRNYKDSTCYNWKLQWVFRKHRYWIQCSHKASVILQRDGLSRCNNIPLVWNRR